MCVGALDGREREPAPAWRTLAIVTLGGLLTSTLLNLIVVPAGYLLVFGRGAPRAEKI